MNTVLTGQETVAATGRATAVVQPRRRRVLSRKWRRALVAYAFLLLPVGFYAVFMILPWIQTIVLSFYNWDGIGTKTGAGFSNFVHVFSDPQLRVAVVHAFELMLYFCVIPIVSALFLTALITGPRRPHWTFTRAVLFLPQVLPAVAVAVIWQWMYGENGFINQVLRWVGLGRVAQPWLASFSWAFPAVGLVGSWITLGLCLAFFIAGAQRIPIDLYEAIATDGGGRFRQFLWVTLPHLRGEIVIAATVTAISAMSAFDIVFVMTGGGPGVASIVPGLLIYQLAFTSYNVGQASALAVVLSLLVLVVITVVRLAGRERR
jgi:raffinose/stachyose/melibiose transport system permease protein